MSGATQNRAERRLTAAGALRLEFGVIGLGILALLMIFQPLHLAIFSVGCGLVVLAALANNLLPLAEPGMPLRKVVFAAVIVATIFCTAVLLAIGAASLYGLAFLNPPPAGASPRPPAAPFWEHPLVWTLLGLDLILAFVITRMVRKR